MSIEKEPPETKRLWLTGELCSQLTRLDMKREDWEQVRATVDKLYTVGLFPLRKL